MESLIQETIEEISSANSINEYTSVVQKCIQKLNSRGYYEIAQQLDKLSKFPNNRFSVEATKDNFIESKT